MSVCVCSLYLLNYWSGDDEIWHARPLCTLLVPFGCLILVGKFSPIRGGRGYISLCLTRTSPSQILIKIDMLKFSGNLLVYIVVLNSVVTFSRELGRDFQFL